MWDALTSPKYAGLETPETIIDARGVRYENVDMGMYQEEDVYPDPEHGPAPYVTLDDILSRGPVRFDNIRDSETFHLLIDKLSFSS